MKITSLLFIIFVLLGFLPERTLAQQKSFGLRSSVNDERIIAAFVVNETQEKSTTSNHEGIVQINFKPNDTLLITHINYKSKKISFSDFNNTIYLEPNSVMLDEVQVSNMPVTANAFKEKLIGMEAAKDPDFLPYGMKKGKSPDVIPVSYDPAVTNSWQYALAKPFSFFQKKLSRDHKMKAKYYQLQANKAEYIEYNKKINRELVQQLTSLEGEALTDFIDYIDLDPSKAKAKSEYELAIYIKNKFKTYQSNFNKED